ncbi:MAG: DNA-binding protein [Nitrospirae bacterium]|nr:MAG: DNA-binding protein [Nitrospirota bacterium]
MITRHQEVLTLDELAIYLRISKSTLYKCVREGKVPCQKIGRHWRFRKAAIDQWLAGHADQMQVRRRAARRA